MELALVPAGEFIMGSDAPEQPPPHAGTIPRPFYMGTTEVTNAQMRRWRPEYDSNDPRAGANIPFQQYIRPVDREGVQARWSLPVRRRLPGDRPGRELPSQRVRALRHARERVTKGGSFEYSPTGVHYFSCACAGRSWNYLGNRNFGTGFRVVVEVPDGVRR